MENSLFMENNLNRRTFVFTASTVLSAPSLVLSSQTFATEASREFLVKWKGGSSDWVMLKDLKDSYPVQLAEYCKMNNIDDEPRCCPAISFASFLNSTSTISKSSPFYAQLLRSLVSHYLTIFNYKNAVYKS